MSEPRRITDTSWRKLVREIGAREDIYGPRLTCNPAKAAVIHLPRQGRKLTKTDKEFDTWQKRHC